MAQTVSQAQARTEAVLATASTWVSARRKSDGKAFFYIPGSTPGAVYMTAATQPAPMRRLSVSLAPICSEAGCDDDAGRTGRCWSHARQVAA